MRSVDHYSPYLPLEGLDDGGSEGAGRVLINDLGRHAFSTGAAVRDAVERVLGSGWYVLGAEGKAFEREFAAYCGAAHCVGVANGTDAIELGLRALGVGPGSRVATVANAGFYTTTALLALGARPVFVDVDPDTKLMRPAELERAAAGGGLDAVVVTHLFGLLHDMDAILDVAAHAGVPVFEDCAQSHGAARDGRRAGTFGVAAAFSFYPTKNLGALGDAGAVVTGDAHVAERVRRLRQYGWESKYRAGPGGGRNSRLDEMQAAVLRAKLPFLDSWNDRRRAIAARYSREIAHPKIQCPPVHGEEFVGHLYVVVSDDREALRARLASACVLSDVHYPVPDHRQPALAGLGDPAELPVTDALAGSILTLPCYPELSDGEVTRVISCLNTW
ncbi:DegT/DnrJ/EryC1/StrS family aminotransferase [Nonomuraea cavernae]|uniref:Aminotransferase n=1 Tax=Nonomuraea cavernae TaxID=2045107 RepID=A0A918DI74_9ACTN|nr:DegT/DnrJ/EryC1/StrS family aminotransferase [Nonomuraea cavernae]MCA2185151.1 DegT/DnrJ/EryC1/StrS family aminotransferase [Nonomuraea cavernae]GGO65566.1 aminotransferase [Nonomuraea cavernae]